MQKSLIVIILVIAVAVGGVLIWQNYNQPVEEPVACAEDTMLCPDGSYVSRVAPSCEFAECPVVEEPTDCVAEGEITEGALITGGEGDPVCCEGLTMIYDLDAYQADCSLMPTPRNLVCANCGDSVCGLGENVCNCPSDCNDIVDCSKEGEKTLSWKDSLICCAGLTKIGNPAGFSVGSDGSCAENLSNGSICAYCGDSVCGLGENQCNCPADCQ